MCGGTDVRDRDRACARRAEAARWCAAMRRGWRGFISGLDTSQSGWKWCSIIEPSRAGRSRTDARRHQPSGESVTRSVYEVATTGLPKGCGPWVPAGKFLARYTSRSRAQASRARM